MAQYLAELQTSSGIVTGGLFQPISSADLPAIPFPGLTDPGVDRIAFWDASAVAIAWLEVGSGLSIVGTTLTATGGAAVADGDYGDITVGSSGAVWTIDAGAVSLMKLDNGAAFSVVGVAGGAAATRADLAVVATTVAGLLTYSTSDGVAWIDNSGGAPGAVITDGTKVLFGPIDLGEPNMATGILPIGVGGTGAALTDPGADRILFFDESVGAGQWLEVGTGLSITGTTLTATGSGGTVTAVSVASANGFAGSSSGGATPALTISTTVTGVLKGNGTAISAAVAGTDYLSPASVRLLDTAADNYLTVAAGDNLTANRTLTVSVLDADRALVVAGNASVSGTNTGDQTITLTGNVTGSGTGSFATTIAAGAVTLAMQANVATGTVFYRKTAGSGAPEVQTLATLKTDLGLTGTNSGDQTITLTGHVTGSGTGSFATTIAAGVVTNAMLAGSIDLTAKVTGVLPSANGGTGVNNGGRTLTVSANSGTISFTSSVTLTVAAAASVSGTNTGDQTITLTGDVTGSGTGSFAATIAADAVTFAKMQNSAAAGLSVVGRSTNSAGDFAEISAANDGEVLRRSGTGLGFGTVATAGIANDAVTYAKMQNVSATDRLLGRDTAAAGDVEELTVAGGLEFTGSGGIQRSALTGDVTASAGSNATTVVSASDTAAGKIEIAVQSEMETGTDTTRAVTPGRQHYHPSAAKAWVTFTVSGTTVTVQSSYNITSVTRTGAGTYTITFDADFSGANAYAMVGTASIDTGSTTILGVCYGGAPPAPAAGSVSIATVNFATGAGADCSRCSLVFFGDQ